VVYSTVRDEMERERKVKTCEMFSLSSLNFPYRTFKKLFQFCAFQTRNKLCFLLELSRCLENVAASPKKRGEREMEMAHEDGLYEGKNSPPHPHNSK